MKNEKLLAIILLSLSFCFVASGVGYGDIPEWMFESTASYIDLQLLEATVKYVMAEPDDFLRISYYYDPTGSFAERFPAGVSTKGKIIIHIIDNRNVFSHKSDQALLEQFAIELSPVYYFIQTVATDMNADIVVAFASEEGETIGYFSEGEYHLWGE